MYRDRVRRIKPDLDRAKVEKALKEYVEGKAK